MNVTRSGFWACRVAWFILLALGARDSDSNSDRPTNTIDFLEEMRLFLKTLNHCKKWIKIYEFVLSKFLKANSLIIDKKSTIEYLSKLKESQSNNYYRKNLLIIKAFLKYLAESVRSDFEFYKVLKVPKEIHGIPRHFTIADLNKVIESFEGNRFYLQIKAFLLLGAFTGARAEELYQIQLTDMDIQSRTLHIRNDNEHSTKKGKSRTTFFNRRTQKALIEYLEWRKQCKTGLNSLFGQSHITRILRDSPLKAHDLRHLFSIEATKRNLNYQIKEILLGHSIRNSTDLGHYLTLTTEELKQAYDNAF